MFWPFLIPAFALYLLLYIGPSLFGLWVSFTRWAGLGQTMTWVGFDNYVRAFNDEIVRTSFLNTVVLLVVGGGVIFAVTVASMLVLRRAKGRMFIRSVVFFPMIISPVAAGVAIGFMLDPNGLINGVLGDVGLESLRQTWLGPGMIFKCVIAALVWASSGFYVALMMSAVDAIPEYYFEAARLEGASPWQQFRLVTLPLSWDMLAVAGVLCVINLLKVFDLIYALSGTAGDPPVEARTLSLQQYLAVTGGGAVPNLGYASAIAVLLIVMSGVLMIVMRRSTRRDRVEL